jgi:hypothetical protein
LYFIFFILCCAKFWNCTRIYSYGVIIESGSGNQI